MIMVEFLRGSSAFSYSILSIGFPTSKTAKKRIECI